MILADFAPKHFWNDMCSRMRDSGCGHASNNLTGIKYPETVLFYNLVQPINSIVSHKYCRRRFIAHFVCVSQLHKLICPLLRQSKFEKYVQALKKAFAPVSILFIAFNRQFVAREQQQPNTLHNRK